MCGERPSETASRTVTPAGTGARWGMKARRRASLRPRSSSSGVPPQRTSPGGRLLQPRDRARERRLAGAVGADDGDELALVDGQVGAVEDLDVARAHVDVARLQKGRHAGLRVRRACGGCRAATRDARPRARRVIRPPAAARGTAARRARPSAGRPAARSAPARRARACLPRPAARRRAIALAGITKRWLEVPPASRTRCGMTRPRKPSRPASAAALEASSAAATAAVSRTRRGWPPSEAATSSPSASRSSGRISADREHEARRPCRARRPRASASPPRRARRRARRSPTARGRCRPPSATSWRRRTAR